MELVQIINWTVMGIILLVAIIAAVFAVLSYNNTNDPKKYIIEGNGDFNNKLYENFTDRLISDPDFIRKAKEAVINSYA